MKKKIVYVPLAADVLHSGHLNIISKSKKYGDVIIGLLTDNAISKYKKIPLLDYDERLKIVANLKGIKKIIRQDEWDYTKILKKIKPNYFVHGDDWKNGIQKKIRLKVIKELKKNNGKLIEIPYTKNISSSQIKNKILEYTTPISRVSLLKRLINSKKCIRLLEAHNPLSALIVEKASFKQGLQQIEYDGIWSSSLTDSASRGKPDNQSVDYSTRFNGLNEILDVTTKPILFDGDNGGQIIHLPFMVRTLERMGISGLCLEDKIGIKSNSLFQDQTKAKQDTIKNFTKKIRIVCKNRKSKDFLIVARIESFILGKNLSDALKRANAYSASGADAILIHSKDKNPEMIFKFSKKFKQSKFYKPIIVVPSTYPHIKYKKMLEKNISVIIYANHMLRSAYPAMLKTAKDILKNSRSFESEKILTSIKDIISLF